MGNKLARRRQVVDEKYTKPQGLYQHKDVDHKKLRKLILDSKLAPCYPGGEETGFDLEECPICFLYYPSLNRSRCCMKGICTECFLQMKTPNSRRPTQCPFCKTSHYAVEYRGVKSKEEKSKEKMEEQQVIEAKIRIRQQEILADEEMIQKRLEASSTSQILVGEDIQCSSSQSFRSLGDSVEILSHASNSMIRPPPQLRQNRDGHFDLDLEDIMVMEAIWLSIQENGRQRNVSYCGGTTAGEQVSVDCSISNVESSSSPSGGLACAIAALAERQQMSGESSASYSEHASTVNMPSCGNRLSQRIGPAAEYPLENNAIDENQKTITREEMVGFVTGSHSGDQLHNLAFRL